MSRPDADAAEPPVSVVVPTIGRTAQLEGCLAALSGCAPRASEILVVDQSGADEIKSLVERFAGAGARYAYCARRGRNLGLNVGLREAAHETVLITDDDCTVAPSWVGVAARGLASDRGTLLTGRVLAPSDAGHVPSTIDDPTPREHVGSGEVEVLYGGNMACTRSAVLAIGGFDEQLTTSAEDNDLGYRWLRAGGRIRYDPEMVVWHHDWRTPEQLERLYARYARGQGAFYAKHLRQGDARILRFLLRDLLYVVRAQLTALRHLAIRPDAWALGIVRGMPSGLAEGWRAAKR
jgi:GT2 family glycosyltransferase